MLEIYAKVEELGAISQERKQTIKLSDVALMRGKYFKKGEVRHIVFLDPRESEKFKEFARKEGLKI